MHAKRTSSVGGAPCPGPLPRLALIVTTCRAVTKHKHTEAHLVHTTSTYHSLAKECPWAEHLTNLPKTKDKERGGCSLRCLGLAFTVTCCSQMCWMNNNIQQNCQSWKLKSWWHAMLWTATCWAVQVWVMNTATLATSFYAKPPCNTEPSLKSLMYLRYA